MPLIKYIGTAHFRELDAADAKRADPPVTDFRKTTWKRGEAEEVSSAAAEWLTRDLDDEFEEVAEARTMSASSISDSSTPTADGGDAPAGRVTKSSTSKGS